LESVTSAPAVGVVVTTYERGLDYLPAALASIAAQTFSDQRTTVAVDGGDPATLRYLEEEWPQVNVVSTAEPAGFAGIVRAGIDASEGRYVAVMNDDVELEPDWLRTLVGALEADPKLGFATGKTLLYHERDLVNETWQVVYTCGRFEAVGLLERDAGQYDEPRATAVATGAASLYRREALELAGGFDPDYFLYCEDADLCLRMGLRGYRGLYLPDARAYHAWAASTGRTSDAARYFGARNSLTTLLKDFPAPVLLTSLPKILLYQVHTLNVARGVGSGPVVLRAWRDFLRRMPATLRKRRAVMRERAIGAREFRGLVDATYPVPTGLTPHEVWRWLQHRIMSPLVRLRRAWVRRRGG
jgi:GT2 family glycosyltransferase